MDSFESLEYPVDMGDPSTTDSESQLRLWIKKNKRENSRLEFKLKVDLSTPGAKAEFIRDVIALANSEGEDPREDGHLVIGFKDGRFHESNNAHYDGATFGQLLDSNIFPPLKYAYEQFSFPRARRVGVLTLKPDSCALYVVKKKLQDGNGRTLLTPGQTLGRKADRKVDLDGEAIHARLQDIVDRKVSEATAPLRKRIDKLEREGGPAFEVKQIRFAMEGSSDWSNLEAQLDKLMPYAREFDYVVKNEVLDAVVEATGRTRRGMPLSVAQSVDAVLGELMPVGFGGMHYPARKQIPNEAVNLLERIEHATFELTWDACRYLRDIGIVDIAAWRYWSLIRFATLNGLEHFQSECLKNARYCAQISMEERQGKTFPEAQKKLQDQIADALDAFECPGYEIKTPSPRQVKPLDFAACVAIVKTGDAVNWKSAKNELRKATALALAWKDKQIVGVGAIKRERREYAIDIAEKSGVKFPPETLELGYVAVAPEHRGHHLSQCIVRALLRQYQERLFATTYTPEMKRTLKRFGFVNKGGEWRGRKEMLSFWEKE